MADEVLTVIGRGWAVMLTAFVLTVSFLAYLAVRKSDEQDRIESARDGYCSRLAVSLSVLQHANLSPQDVRTVSIILDADAFYCGEIERTTKLLNDLARAKTTDDINTALEALRIEVSP
jgi:hypothetical protein